MRVRPHAWRPLTVLGRLGEHETLLDGAEVVGAGGLGRLEKSGGAATAAAVMDDRTEVQLGRRNDIVDGDAWRAGQRKHNKTTIIAELFAWYTLSYSTVIFSP